MVRKMKLQSILYVIFGAAALLVLADISIYFLNFHGSFSDDHQKWGTFGDYLGGTLNPTLSFLGLLALLLTLSLQNKQTEISVQELKLSRTELVQSRKELSRSAEAQELSSTHQARQVRIQELTAKISVIQLLLSYDGQVLKERLDMGGYSVSTIHIKDFAGLSKRKLLEELAEIYLILKKIES